PTTHSTPPPFPPRRSSDLDAVRAGAGRRPQRGEGIVRVQAVAVEEMLRVVDHLPAEPAEVAHRIRDHAEVFLAARLEHALHVEGDRKSTRLNSSHGSTSYA